MTSANGRVGLSAIDLLGLAEQRKVARLDLAEVGYAGVVYVCDLSAAQQQRILTGPRRGKTRIYRDNSMDVDWSDLSQDAASKFMEACLVTDAQGGELLERAFAALEERPGSGDEDAGVVYVVMPAKELVFMADQMAAELGQRRLVLEKLEQFPNAIASLVVRTVRQLSGMAEDRVEEKKQPS